MPGVQISSQKFRVAAPASAALFAELRNANATKRKRIREILVTAETAVAAGGALGIYRATNVPAGGTLQLSQAVDPADPASDLNSVTGVWTTAPTVGTIPLDGTWMPAVIGGQAALIWIPGEELIIGAGATAAGSLVFKAETALPALTIKVKHTEA
jgi:hypothetical protein